MSKKKANTRDKILETAVEVFNERGCSVTSLRTLASKLSISDGNLRYYFATKEDLILTLFTEMNERMLVLYEQYMDTENMTLQQYRNSLYDNYLIMYEYRFMFIESVYLLKNFEQYQILYTQLQSSRKDLFLEIFNSLINKGVLENSFSSKNYSDLFEHIFIFSDNWIKYHELNKEEGLPIETTVNHYVDLCVALIFPYMKSKNY